MARYYRFCIILWLLSNHITIANTLVYSMKIRRVFLANARQSIGKENKNVWGLTALPIAYARNRTFNTELENGPLQENRLSLGSVLDIRYISPRNFWLEATTAIQTEKARAQTLSGNAHYQRTGMDDIVLSGGYNMFPTPEMQLVVYGISGVPTRRAVNALDTRGTLVGTRFFSAGLGSEISYSFISSKKRSLIALFQNRFIHFFPRSWSPILPCGSTIYPGDTFDLLYAVKFREKREFFEIGYNPTFFLHQAIKTPAAGTIKTRTFVSQGGYINYSHLIDSYKHPVLLGAGLACNRSRFLNTHTYIGWFNITVIL